MPKVFLKTPLAGINTAYTAGSVVTVDDETAKAYIGAGYAVTLEDEITRLQGLAEAPTAEGDVEPVTRRRGRPRKPRS